MLSWSPDAKQLVFEVVAPDGPIKIWDLRSNRVNTLGDGAAPAWSPSGEWIAYFYGDGVRAVHPDGTGEKTIVQRPRAGFIIRRQLEFRESPVWSPDSAHLVAERPDDRRIWDGRADGGFPFSEQKDGVQECGSDHGLGRSKIEGAAGGPLFLFSKLTKLWAPDHRNRRKLSAEAGIC
jgi:hypothetical protein